MKHTIGLIAPREPETLALLTQQRSTWQQARRQAIRYLLGGRAAGEVVDDLRQRFGLWPAMAVRLVRQAQSLLHPGSDARRQYLDYLAAGDDGAADELSFYQGLPEADDVALAGVDYRSPDWIADGDTGLSLLYVPALQAFYLSLPLANPDGSVRRLEGLPVLFADAEAAELKSLARGDATGKAVVVPSQELIWWEGTPHLVLGFDPDDCVTGYEAIRQPARTGLVATAAVAATMTFQSALPVVGVAMAAETPTSYQVAIGQTPIVKVLDSATGRQLMGVRLVAEDGKVLARSDDSGTLVLPSNYARYNLFNLVKEGYQFMLLESTQLTPHNLLRVEMAPVAAKGQASNRTAAITPPPALPNQTRPRTTAQSAKAPAPKPPAQTRQAAKPPASHAPATLHTTATKPQQPAKVAVAPNKAPAQHPAPAKPKPEQHAAVLPVTKPAPQHHTETRHDAPKPTQAAPSKPQLPRTGTQPRMAEPMSQLIQTPRTPAPASSYRVKRGDTLWSIAQSQLGAGHRWMSIYALNKGTLSDPARIQVGQVLQLPARHASTAAARVKITVRSGESLSLIALRRLGRVDRWREIYDMNRQTLKSPRLIFPGQTLWIPSR